MRIVEPGMVKTDFASRSFDFSNDPTLADYQPLVGAFMSALGPMAAHASSPDLVAEVIFRAATDEGDRLRYEAGPDAEQMLGARRASDDATFIAGVRAQFGLHGPG